MFILASYWLFKWTNCVFILAIVWDRAIIWAARALQCVLRPKGNTLHTLYHTLPNTRTQQSSSALKLIALCEIGHYQKCLSCQFRIFVKCQSNIFGWEIYLSASAIILKTVQSSKESFFIAPKISIKITKILWN